MVDTNIILYAHDLTDERRKATAEPHIKVPV